MPQVKHGFCKARHSSFLRQECRRAREWRGEGEEVNMVFNHGIHRIHGMMVLLVLLFGVAVSAVAAEPGITVEARQRYPWNGLVDLKFTITGESGTKYDTSFTAKDMVGGTNIAMKTIRKSNGVAAEEKEKLLPGTYNWVWDAAADLPDGFKCDRMTVTGAADISAFPYTVKFNANGGTGTMANQSFTYGTSKALTANAFTRTGYVFQDWATSANSGKVYNDKQKVQDLTTTSGAVVNFYAVWGKDPNMVQLWNGGPFWAIKNVGADKPSDYGYYFWWGDTVGYKWENGKWIASDGSNSNFSFVESKIPTYGKSNSVLQGEGWITVDGVLAPEHDAARKHWGGDWRMPTKQEFEDLDNKCDWIWTTMNGVNGYVVCGRGDYSSASIFLPCAGYGTWTLFYQAGLHGYFWSSVPDSLYYYAWYLNFDSGRHSTYDDVRSGGRSVRPVQSSTK